jgi:hypothetical protein
MTGELLGLKVVRPKDFPILSLFVSPSPAHKPSSKSRMNNTLMCHCRPSA